ncbi:hypothetical protein OF117_02415 [Geodermatophilus sp. YIM 151500]|uniref:hypothetical protein n=1 Tax=Geodermatophilus sp. YIM 151500 TaxID=2984531 RepID=UPI0021E47035|nr:hypothetical protein [Geodermatophilus sp. YIM 151500]MCV2488206.1 hypothetical protein [Geodermatophilus sp. YIM 151500]
MGLFSKAAKAGIAKKVIDEARKPHNQAKIKKFVNDLTSKNRGHGPGTPPPGRSGRV